MFFNRKEEAEEGPPSPTFDHQVNIIVIWLKARFEKKSDEKKGALPHHQYSVIPGHHGSFRILSGRFLLWSGCRVGTCKANNSTRGGYGFLLLCDPIGMLADSDYWVSGFLVLAFQSQKWKTLSEYCYYTCLSEKEAFRSGFWNCVVWFYVQQVLVTGKQQGERFKGARRSRRWGVWGS